MLKMYCSQCGCGVEYLANKPKFCTNCGTAFDKTIQAKNVEFKKIIPKRNIIEDDYELEEGEDDADSNSVPEIENLEYDISIPSKHKETIGNLIGTSTAESDLNLPNFETKQMNREEFLENFAKEAGSLRGKPRKKNGPKN